MPIFPLLGMGPTAWALIVSVLGSLGVSVYTSDKKSKVEAGTQKELAKMTIEGQERAQKAELAGAMTLEERRNEYHKQSLLEQRTESDRIATQGKEMARFQLMASQALGMQQTMGQMAVQASTPMPIAPIPQAPLPDLMDFVRAAGG